MAQYGNTLSNTQNIQNFGDQVSVNTSTTNADINNMTTKYFTDLQNYLNPSMDNLQLIQNISSMSNGPSNNDPYQSNSYTSELGDGFRSNLGFLNGVAYPPVTFGDSRTDQLSQCAKELPMFAASSLLPKPSTNNSDNALSQSAARALAAFTNLGPVEQIGAITSDGSVYSKMSDIRALPQIQSAQTAMFYSTPYAGSSPTYGQTRLGPNGEAMTGASGLM
jgi:hypothetical protein